MTLKEYSDLVRALHRALKSQPWDNPERKAAVVRMRAYMPGVTNFIASHVKYVVAREAGYASWPALRQACAKEKTE